MSHVINKSIFKAYDVRGRYPDELSEEVAREITKVLANKFEKGRVVVGCDTRLSSSSIYGEVIKVFSDHGFEVEEIGLCTTPMFYFLANKLKAVGGVMVTASHSPKDFNGLKVVNDRGENISGEQILKWIT